MKSFALARGTAACAPALEFYPAACAAATRAPRAGRARSDGTGPRHFARHLRRAGVTTTETKPGNWSRQARCRRSRRDSEPDGKAVCI
jgi:hypothetical protein